MIPVPVNEWNKRKFFMKTAQYMALGIPPVCTPMGSNPEVIEHGRTGFLAGTDAEWVEHLSLLVRDGRTCGARWPRAPRASPASASASKPTRPRSSKPSARRSTER